MPVVLRGPRFWLGSGLAIALALAGARACADGPLRLEEAVAQALSTNERAAKSRLRVDVADGQLDRARTAFFPTLAASGSGTVRPEADKSGRIGSTTTSLTLSQPILSASAFPQYAQARHQLESEKWGAKQDRRQLAYDAARAFLQTLSAEHVADAAVRRLERARANKDNADARAATGLASVNDATRAALDLTTAERDRVGAQASVTRAYLTLGFLIGHAVKPPLAAPERTTSAASGFESDVKDGARRALERRADVISARERTEASRASADEPLFRLVPTVSAQAQLRVLPAPLPTETTTDETATLNLVWTIFDSGSRYADRRTRLAQAESQALDESLLRRSVETDVATAMASLKAARESLRFADEGVAAAVRNTDETEILYKQGLARALELTDANGRRFDAEVSRESAKLAMEQAYLDLRFALGLGPVDEDVP